MRLTTGSSLRRHKTSRGKQQRRTGQGGLWRNRPWIGKGGARTGRATTSKTDAAASLLAYHQGQGGEYSCLFTLQISICCIYLWCMWRNFWQGLALEKWQWEKKILAEPPLGRLTVSAQNFGRISPWKIDGHRWKFWQNLPLGNLCSQEQILAEPPPGNGCSEAKILAEPPPWELQVSETEGWVSKFR